MGGEGGEFFRYFVVALRGGVRKGLLRERGSGERGVARD